MQKNSERVYWMTNKSWYTINIEKDCFELTSEAPPRARKSYEMWQKPQKITLRGIWISCKTYFR